MSSVIIYTLRSCPTSERAKKRLLERGVEFEERRVDESRTWWDEATKYAFTVPIIIWDNGDIEIGWEGDHG